MKLLYLTPDYPPTVRTGIATYVQSMARAMVRAGHEAHVLTCEIYGGQAEEEDHGVRVHRRPVSRIPGARRALSSLPRTWQGRLPQQAMTRPGRRIGLGLTSLREAHKLRIDFDIVETPDYFSPGWGVALSRAWPVLTVLHTPLAVEAKYSNLPRHLYLESACAIERWSTGMSSGVSAPSALIRDELRAMQWQGADHATIDRIGIDLSRIPPNDEQPNPDRVLIVGHITPRKGHDVLAKAVGRLAKSRPGIHVVCLGSYGTGFQGGRPFQQSLEAEVARSNVQWTFLDHVDRESLSYYYATASVVVAPSRFDNFPMAPLEALLAGRPVIITDKCGLVEVCETGPGTGLWATPSEDDESLALVLEEIMSGYGRGTDLSARARATAESVADIDRLVPDRLNLYRSLDRH